MLLTPWPLALIVTAQLAGQMTKRYSYCALRCGFWFFPDANNQAWLLIPSGRSGTGGGMASTARLIGQTIGALIVALTFRLYPDNVGATLSLYIAAGVAILASLISSTRVLAHKPAKT